MKVLSGQSVQFKYFSIILTLFAATWLSADVAAVKFVSVLGITLTGGFIVFPFTTMLGCIIVEVYGYKNARQAIWAGLTLNIVFVFFINLVYFIPSSPSWNLNEEFKNILLPETRIVAASLVSFFISEFLNSYLMAKMKTHSPKSLIKRILVSSAFSFFFDVSCFLILAFYGKIPDAVLTKLIFYAYIKKILFQILLFPAIVVCVKTLKKYEGVDISDYNTTFNPFSLENVYELHPSFKLKANLVENKIVNDVNSW